MQEKLVLCSLWIWAQYVNCIIDLIFTSRSPTNINEFVDLTETEEEIEQCEEEFLKTCIVSGRKECAEHADDFCSKVFL